MSESRRFLAPGSPLHGKKVPMDWSVLSITGKRRALVSYGYAPDYEKACRIMGLHRAEVMRARRLKMEKTANRRHPEGKD